MEDGNKYGTLEIFTHGVRIRAKDDRVSVAVRRMLSNWVITAEEKVENHRGDVSKKTVVKQLYGAAFPNQKDFWLHKGQLKELDIELKTMGLTLTDLEIDIHEVHKPAKASFHLKPGRVLRDYQENAKEFALSPISNGDHFSKLIAMPTGTGKGNTNDTPIPTPDGWIEMGEIVAGDRVYTADGHSTTVEQIYPLGIQEVYKVTFEDGRTSRVTGDHLWKVHSDGLFASRWRTKTTAELQKLLKTSRKTFYIPLMSLDLTTPRAQSGRIYDHICSFINIESIDDDSFQRYGNGTSTQRLEFVQGVMDSSAATITSNSITLSVSSYEFAEKIMTLLRSVGAVTLLELDVTPSTENPWVIHVRHSDPHRLFKRRDRKEVAYRNVSCDKLAIRSIKLDGFEECTCIEVAHPSHLYLCDDYIVTHNTVSFCGTAAENGERTVVGVLPKYFKKWCKDLESNLDISPKQIMPVDTISQLRGVIDLCKTQGNKKLPPLIVMNLLTLRTFYDKFVEDPEGAVEDMGCEPWEIMGLLGVGVFAIDEAHEHIHTVFRTAMYLHGVKFIALSGTMRTEDVFQERVQNTIFPMIRRYLDVKMAKYIDVEFIGYNFDPSVLPKMRFSAFGRSDYSHPVLEKSIMRYPNVLKDYIRMTTDLLDYDYIPRSKGKRALIFVATVELADKMILALTMKYPHLHIVRYCAAQGDKYEDLLTADLAVSTLQSSGTAVDIANLITVICTTMVNSSKSNLQALGRLRELPNGGKVSMYLPYCKQNGKHRKYMSFRYELFKDITKSIKSFIYDRWIGGH